MSRATGKPSSTFGNFTRPSNSEKQQLASVRLSLDIRHWTSWQNTLKDHKACRLSAFRVPSEVSSSKLADVVADEERTFLSASQENQYFTRIEA
jgi:hypothetical protein